MHVSIDISIVPIGVGVSLSAYVAECIKIFEKNDLDYTLHAFGTNIQGDWDTVFAAVKACHENLHTMQASRLYSVVKISTRIDKIQPLQDKINSVHEKLLDSHNH